MPIKLPQLRTVRIVLLAFSCAVLVLHYYWSNGDGPTASQVADARAQLLANMQSDTGSPAACQVQRERFERMLRQASPSGALDNCEIGMLGTLGRVLSEAEADFAAGRHDVAFSKAQAVVAHNQAVLGKRSLLAIAVASVRATEAMALMQKIAAMALDPVLRRRWRQEVAVSLEGQMKDANLASAIVNGEARDYVSGDTSDRVAHDLAQPDIDKMIVAYAGLQRDLERGDAFLPRCLERMDAVPVCTIMARIEHEQRALHADTQLLAAMLEPRR